MSFVKASPADAVEGVELDTYPRYSRFICSAMKLTSYHLPRLLVEIGNTTDYN